ALWFAPLIETLIAVSILYMAIENVLGTKLARRWALAFAFGLVHGFGFAFGLQEQLQFAGAHLLSSLVSFNVGVELGQLAVLLILIPGLNLIYENIKAEKTITLLLSLIVGHTAWHWMLERWERLSKFPLPEVDAATLASALRWLMFLLVLGAIGWIASRKMKQ